MAMFQISAIIGYQGGKEPPDSSSSVPYPHVTPSAQMKSWCGCVFVCRRQVNGDWEHRKL